MRVFSLIVLIVLFAIVIAPAVPPAAGTATEKQLETKIESATIYSGIAQVTRTGRIDIKKGIYRVICKDLPSGFEESSLQVEGEGTARATILGVDIVELPGEVSETPKYKELKKRLETLEIARDSLQITLLSFNKRQEFITSLGSQPFKERKDQEPLDIFRVQDWKTLMDFLETDPGRSRYLPSPSRGEENTRRDQLDQGGAQFDAGENSMEKTHRHRM